MSNLCNEPSTVPPHQRGDTTFDVIAVGIEMLHDDRDDRLEETCRYVRQHGLDADTLATHGPILVRPLRFFTGGRFELDDTGTLAAVLPVRDVDACTIRDYCAWPLGDPTKFAVALGIGDCLGADQIANPASFAFGQALPIYRLPLTWLKAGCRGIALLNHFTAWRWLNAALGPVEAEDPAHARELYKLARRRPEPVIRSRSSSMRVAA